MVSIVRPSKDELSQVFEAKYTRTPELGLTPATYRRFRYHSPDDHYEALVSRLVTSETRWLDVGCGRMLFPSNEVLARVLAERCAHLVGVDPDSTILENPFVDEAVQAPFEDFRAEKPFDLVTMRMVAEHVQDPVRVMATLADCTQSDSLVVLYTVNARSPIPMMTRLMPFGLRHPLKKFLWRTEEKDTFPTAFRMNTREALAELFAQAGFEEALFCFLDDCRTFTRFSLLMRLELTAMSLFRRFSMAYPENCLLGVYRRL